MRAPSVSANSERLWPELRIFASCADTSSGEAEYSPGAYNMKFVSPKIAFRSDMSAAASSGSASRIENSAMGLTSNVAGAPRDSSASRSQEPARPIDRRIGRHALDLAAACVARGPSVAATRFSHITSSSSAIVSGR